LKRYSDDEPVVDLGDFLRYSLSRRGALKVGLTLGATALAADVLAACSSGNGAPGGGASGGAGPVAAASPPMQGGVSPTPRNQTVITEDPAIFTVFDSFNPYIPNGSQYQGGQGQVCEEYLWYLNLATGELKPWQGTGWQYNGDFTQLTFGLNPKVHWNDGQPFTSADVKFTLEMLQKDKTLLGQSFTDEIKSVEAPDDHTVAVKLNTADPRFHYNLICGIVSAAAHIVPQHVWSRQDPTKFKNNPPVFTGPYKLKQVLANQFLFVWEKDPNYWNKDQLDPAPQYAVFRTAPVPDTAVQDFKQAKVDVGGYDQVHVQALIDAGYKNAIITPMIDPCPRGFIINCDPSKGVLAEPQFRYAISMLVDRQKMASSIWVPQTTPATYPWAAYPNNKKWENADIAAKYPLKYDPQKAAQVLDQIAPKGGDGKRTYKGKAIPGIEIITPTQPPGAEYEMGQLLAKELQNQGIDASVKYLAGPVYNDRYYKGQYDIRSEYLCGELFDPSQLYQLFYSKYYTPIGKNAPEQGNYSDDSRLKDQTLSDLVTQLGKASPDDPAAKATFDTALDAFFKAMPAFASIQTLYTHQHNTTYWTGWPTKDNLYMVPNHWWGQYLFVIGSLKAAGG
jgi:peptide/nickel transport system substrate-binding protein